MICENLKKLMLRQVSGLTICIIIVIILLKILRLDGMDWITLKHVLYIVNKIACVFEAKR